MIRKNEIIGFGLRFVDNFVGGLQNGLNMIYGPPASGKTTFAYHFAINMILQNEKNVVYFDNDHAFNIDRFLQIAKGNKNILKRLILFRPKSVNEFKLMIENLNKIGEMCAIVIDSIAMPYRVEFLNQSPKKMISEMLNDIVKLRNFAEEHNLPVLLINQIYSNVINGKKKYEMIGSENIKYLVPIILELDVDNNRRILKIIKHPTKPTSDFLFEIDELGIKPYHKFMKKQIKKRSIDEK